MAINTVEEDWVIRTINVFCTTSPIPAAARNSRVSDWFMR